VQKIGQTNDNAVSLRLIEDEVFSYVLTDDEGEIYLCNARCLYIWAVSLATEPGLSEDLKNWSPY
jgi:hypothetical protein